MLKIANEAKKWLLLFICDDICHISQFLFFSASQFATVAIQSPASTGEIGERALTAFSRECERRRTIVDTTKRSVVDREAVRLAVPIHIDACSGDTSRVESATPFARVN